MASLSSGVSEEFQKLRARTSTVIRRLTKAYPDAQVALHHANPLQLLVATILSAQCTDERVNMVTPKLFKKYRTAKDYTAASPRELEQEIRSTGFYRAKARSIIGCCRTLVEKYGGKIPASMEDLLTLPGVGRKTANVVLGNVFGVAEGIVVDTHVRRLAQRLGFSRNSDPEKIERDLMKIVPKKNWIAFGNLMIWHGRKVCRARRPNCPECPVGDLCPSFAVFMKLRDVSPQETH